MVKQAQTQPTKKNQAIVKDQRFRKLNYDPKFKPVPQDMKKVKVDKRFAGMMTNQKFKVISKVDKYGRKVDNPKQNKELKQYYQMEEEQSIPQEQDMELEQQDEQYEHSLGSKEQQNLQNWMENYNEQSDTESELQIEELLQSEEELWSDDEKVIKNQNVKITKRLALCNYDWTHIKPSDLMIIFNSFKPATGYIQKIQLYQSDFGRQRMANESVQGPGDIWKKKQQTNDKITNRKKILKKLFTHGKKQAEETDIDMQKLRQYEKERMRYYYAVIYCDSKSTAEAIYTVCDGKELQNSNNIDLRFIPNDLVFPRQPQEVCDKVPQKSGDIKNKIMRSIGHSHVKLSWEDPQAGNLSKLKNISWDKLKNQQYEGVDWSLYINDQMSEGEKERQKQRQQLEEEQVSGSEMQVEENKEAERYRRNNKKDRISDNNEEMQIFFSGGFDLANKVKAKRQEEVQKRQEKRQIKKEKQFKKKAQKGSKKHKRDQEQNQQQQEEEVDIAEKEKRKDYLELMVDKKKAKKQFTPDLNDPRFKDVYKNPNLQIDPNSSLFNPQKSGNIFKEVVRRVKNKNQ